MNDKYVWLPWPSYFHYIIGKKPKLDCKYRCSKIGKAKIKSQRSPMSLRTHVAKSIFFYQTLHSTKATITHVIMSLLYYSFNMAIFFNCYLTLMHLHKHTNVTLPINYNIIIWILHHRRLFKSLLERCLVPFMVKTFI